MNNNNKQQQQQQQQLSMDKYLPAISSAATNTGAISNESFTSPITVTAEDYHENEDEQDLNIFVKELLEQMQTRFSDMSVNILGKIEEMGTRIDDLENSINVLVDQAGISDLNGSSFHHDSSNTNNNSSNAGVTNTNNTTSLNKETKDT